MQRLFGDELRIALLDLAHRAQQELVQLHLQLGLHLLRVGSGLQAANQVQPVEFGTIEHIKGAALDDGRITERNPKGGGVAGEALAKEARWRNADDREGLAIDEERCADNRGVFAEFLLPRAVAEDRHWRRALLIVRRAQ